MQLDPYANVAYINISSSTQRFDLSSIIGSCLIHDLFGATAGGANASAKNVTFAADENV
jgi:hypothetical protein